MEKVKVNREIFEALESVFYFYNKNGEMNEEHLIALRVNRSFLEEREPLNDYPIKDFMKVLLYGYELQLSEDELLEIGLKTILSFITHNQILQIIHETEKNNPDLISEGNKETVKMLKEDASLLFKIYKKYVKI